MKASRFDIGGGFFTTKPPLEPTGTITAFLTIWAFTKPSTSVRKSSAGHSTAGRRGNPAESQVHPGHLREVTKISNRGRGSGIPAPRAGRS